MLGIPDSVWTQTAADVKYDSSDRRQHGHPTNQLGNSNNNNSDSNLNRNFNTGNNSSNSINICNNNNNIINPNSLPGHIWPVSFNSQVVSPSQTAMLAVSTLNTSAPEFVSVTQQTQPNFLRQSTFNTTLRRAATFSSSGATRNPRGPPSEGAAGFRADTPLPMSGTSNLVRSDSLPYKRHETQNTSRKTHGGIDGEELVESELLAAAAAEFRLSNQSRNGSQRNHSSSVAARPSELRKSSSLRIRTDNNDASLKPIRSPFGLPKLQTTNLCLNTLSDEYPQTRSAGGWNMRNSHAADSNFELSDSLISTYPDNVDRTQTRKVWTAAAVDDWSQKREVTDQLLEDRSQWRYDPLTGHALAPFQTSSVSPYNSESQSFYQISEASQNQTTSESDVVSTIPFSNMSLESGFSRANGTNSQTQMSTVPSPFLQIAPPPENYRSSYYSFEPTMKLNPPNNCRFFVIKSQGEQDVLTSLRHGVWTSTALGNERLDKAFRDCSSSMNNQSAVWLLFSIQGSGLFSGVAEMKSSVDFGVSSDLWQVGRWKGLFDVKWIFVVDIPNSALRHIRMMNTPEKKPVTNARDTQEILSEAAHQMLDIFSTYPARSSLLQNFVVKEHEFAQS